MGHGICNDVCWVKSPRKYKHAILGDLEDETGLCFGSLLYY